MPQIIMDDEDGTLAMLRNSVAAFAEEFPGPARLRAGRAAGHDLDRQVWTAMAEAGWTALTLPEDLGGLALGPREQSILSEALGRALLVQPLAHLAVFSAGLICAAVAGAERDRLAGGLVDGSLLVAPAWQGRDGSATRVQAQRVGDEIHLRGTLHYVNAAASATDFLVLADFDDGPAIISVPAGGAGISCDYRPTVDGTSRASVTLGDLAVSADRILLAGPEALQALDQAIAATRLALAAELVGLAGRALEITVDYTSERIQFGKPIASFQVIQHRLVDMWAEAEFAAAAIVNAVEVLAGGDTRAGNLAILAAKARAGDAAVVIGRQSIHLHGAMGFTDECDIGLYLKRALTLSASLGQPEQLRLAFVALERAA